MTVCACFGIRINSSPIQTAAQTPAAFFAARIWLCPSPASIQMHTKSTMIYPTICQIRGCPVAYSAPGSFKHSFPAAEKPLSSSEHTFKSPFAGSAKNARCPPYARHPNAPPNSPVNKTTPISGSTNRFSSTA